MKFMELKILLAREMKKAESAAPENTKRFIVAAYRKVARIISSFYTDTELATTNKIVKLPITQNMITKLTHMLTLPIPITKPTESLQLQLQKIPGIGLKKAKQLIKDGLTDIKQLNQKKWKQMLNSDTQLALTLKPARKIPRSYIVIVEKEIQKFRFPEKNPVGNYPVAMIVGSYRRRMPFSKDIDVLLRSNDKTIIDSFIDFVNKKFRAHVYAKGPDKASFIITNLGNPKLTVKLDAFRADASTFYTHLLYSTGSKEFNIRMRSHARRQNLLLNQKGIFDATGKKINKPSDDEKALFRILKFPYAEPWQR